MLVNCVWQRRATDDAPDISFSPLSVLRESDFVRPISMCFKHLKSWESKINRMVFLSLIVQITVAFVVCVMFFFCLVVFLWCQVFECIKCSTFSGHILYVKFYFWTQLLLVSITRQRFSQILMGIPFNFTYISIEFTITVHLRTEFDNFSWLLLFLYIHRVPTKWMRSQFLNKICVEYAEDT